MNAVACGVTFFGALCLAAALSACAGKSDRAEVTRPAGAQSKIGRLLTSQRWCAAPRLDTTNNTPAITIKEFAFRDSGEFVLTRYRLNPDSTKTIDGRDTGRWAVLDNTLVLRNGERELALDFTASTRETDGSTCLNWTAAANTLNGNHICACELD